MATDGNGRNEMDETYLSQDPNAGLEDEYLSTDPNAGLEQEKPGIVSNAIAGAGDVIKGFAQQFIPDLSFKNLASIAYAPVNAQITGYHALKSIVDTGQQVAEAENTEPFSRERFAAGFNVAGQLGLLALGGRKPTLKEVAGLEKPTEAMPQTPEPPISETVPPITPETKLPDWAREEMVNRGLDPNRPLNDIDIQNPSVREAVQQDPTLTESQKQQILKTGSVEEVIPSATQGIEGTKVVDESGKPIRVYHGTRNVFQEFEPSAVSTGIHFSESPEIASAYAENFGIPKETGNPNVHAAYLDIKNPAPVEVVDQVKTDFPASQVKSELIRRGYDGIEQKVQGKRAFVAFNKNQVIPAYSEKGIQITKGGETSASEITSPESVTQPEVRPRVGEEAPLRQQGETAPAREEIPVQREEVTTFAPYADEILSKVSYVDKPESRLASDAAGLYNRKLKEINLPAESPHNPVATEFVKAHEQAHAIWDGLQNVTAAEMMRADPEAFAAFRETSAGKSQIIRHKIKGDNVNEPSSYDWIEAVPDLYAEMKVKGIRNPALENWLKKAIPEGNRPSAPVPQPEQPTTKSLRDMSLDELSEFRKQQIAALEAEGKAAGEPTYDASDSPAVKALDAIRDVQELRSLKDTVISPELGDKMINVAIRDFEKYKAGTEPTPVSEVAESATVEPKPKEGVPTETTTAQPLPKTGEAPSTGSGPVSKLTWQPTKENKFNVFNDNAHTTVELDKDGNVRLRGVEVNAGKRGKGLGRDFAEGIVADAAQKFPSAKEVVVWAFPDAEGFWRKAGFEPTGKTEKANVEYASQLNRPSEEQTLTELRRPIRTGTQPVPPPVETPPTPAEVPITPQKPSKIGQSIEAKAVEAKLTEGFSETAGYDPITIKDQAERATSFVESSPDVARSVIRGDAPLPEGLRGTPLITAMEERLLKKPDAQLAYELANSPLVSETSAAAQELRMARERIPDSITAKFQEIRDARKAGSQLRGETTETVAKEIGAEIVKNSSKRPTWEAFVREITC